MRIEEKIKLIKRSFVERNETWQQDQTIVIKCHSLDISIQIKNNIHPTKISLRITHKENLRTKEQQYCTA